MSSGWRSGQMTAGTPTLHPSATETKAGEHYANVWQVRGDTVANGVRELLHPHDDEQPFTRSQAGVAAGGRVTVEAADTVHGFGGSAVVLDLSALEMPFDLIYEIRRRRE